MSEIIAEVKSIGESVKGLGAGLEKHQADMAEVKSAIADLQRRAAYGGAPSGRVVCDGVKSMIDYMAGRTAEVKAVTAAGVEAVLNPVNGGYLAVEEYVKGVVEMMAEGNPLMGEVDLQSVNANILGVPVEKDRPAVTFQGEIDMTPASTVKVGMVHIPVRQASTAVPLSRALIQGANLVDIEAYTAKAVANAFADKMGEVILTGDGVNQPSGIINNKSLKTVKSGASKGVNVDSLFDVVGALPEQADANAKWFMKKSTFFKIAGALGKDSSYVHMGLSQDIPRSLLGYPVVFCGAMPNMDTDGNIAALFGDMKSYKAVQAGGIEYLRDPYSDAAQGVVNMRYWTGLGGALVQKDGIIGMKVGA